MEEVFDDSVLSLPGSSQLGQVAEGGGASVPATPEGGATKAKKVLIRKKYKWSDEIRYCTDWCGWCDDRAIDILHVHVGVHVLETWCIENHTGM